MVLYVGVQELCLNIIPTFANLIDYPSMKNSLVPRIKSACLQTSSLAVSSNSHPVGACHTAQLFLVDTHRSHFLSLQVRVNSLVCVGKILEYLDKWFVLDEILPFLQQIPSKEPAVLMGILGKVAFLFLLIIRKKIHIYTYVTSPTRNLQMHL